MNERPNKQTAKRTNEWPFFFRPIVGLFPITLYGPLSTVITSPFVTGLTALVCPWVWSWTQSLAALCFRYFCRLVNIRLHFPHWNRSGSLSSPSDSCPEKKIWNELTTELTIPMVSWVQIPYRPKFFSGLIFTAAQVVYITARITFIHVFIRSSNIWLLYILSRLHYLKYITYDTLLLMPVSSFCSIIGFTKNAIREDLCQFVIG